MKKYLIFFLLLLPSIIAFSKDKSPDSLTVQEIFTNSEKAYLNLETYVDSGKIINEVYNGDKPLKTTVAFKSAYAKKIGFNFDYYFPGSSTSIYIINEYDKVVNIWQGETKKIETGSRFHLAINKAKGISPLTLHIIPTLLMPFPINPKSFLGFIKGDITGSEIIDHDACYVIRGTKPKNERVTVWISQKEFMIRKIIIDKEISLKASETKGELLKGSERSTYYYYPYHPEKIKKKLFKFRPNREVN